MSIIPQDPFLFDGTLAANLDPKQTFTSFEMLDVLAKCQLTKLLDDLGTYFVIYVILIILTLCL